MKFEKHYFDEFAEYILEKEAYKRRFTFYGGIRFIACIELMVTCSSLPKKVL